jgi:hypothetical protein
MRMIGILEIYACAIALVAVVGLATRALVYRNETLWRADILPLGLSVLVGVLSVAAYFVTVEVATMGLLGVSVAILSWYAWTRYRDAARHATAAPAQVHTEGLALAIGVVLGLVALIPLFWMGLPTTVAISIGDGWFYAAEMSWLRDHTLSAHIPIGTHYPLNSALPDQLRGGLTIGFELFATSVGAVTRRAPFELVSPTSATAFAVAAVSWREFWCATRASTRGRISLLVTIVAASPLLVYLYAQNQAPNLLALALFPYAIACGVRFARDPNVRSLAIAGIASGATMGIYIPLAPWLLAGLLGAVIAGSLRRAHFRARPETSSVAWKLVGYVIWVGVLFGSLLLMTGVVAPVSVRQLLRLRSGSGTGVSAHFVGSLDRLGMLTGTAVRGIFALDTTFGGARWTSWIALAAAVGAAVCAVVILCAVRRQRTAVALVPISIALGAATFVLASRFATDAYAQWKALIISGALLAGIVVTLLTAPPDRFRRVAGASLIAVAVVWIGTSASLLTHVVTGEGPFGIVGFRSQDVQLGAKLNSLPSGSSVLVEGVTASQAAFEMRMAAAYFGANANLSVEGLGTTPSYVATDPSPLGGSGDRLPPVGAPGWMPTTPWRWVVSSGATAVATGREAEWSNSAYQLSAAPILDVTPFGGGWIAPRIRQLNATADLVGSGTLVISNRSRQTRAAALSFWVTCGSVPLVFRISAPGYRRSMVVPRNGVREVVVPIRVAANSVTQVHLVDQSREPSRMPILEFSSVDVG